jgi:hypothetical protein
MPVLTLLVVLGLACQPGAPADFTGPPGQVRTFSITLAWDPPTTDATGAPLSDLASYRLYYAQSTPVSKDNSTMVEAGSEPTFRLANLQAGIYYFTVTALDMDGNESDMSGEVSAELRDQ